MGIKTVPHPPYSPVVAPCDFCLFPKLRGCRYEETIEEMKVAVTKVIETLTQEDFDGAFQKLLEQYNKCIEARGEYFEGDLSFMCVLSIKVPIRKKSGKLPYAPRIYIYNDCHNLTDYSRFYHLNFNLNILIYNSTCGKYALNDKVIRHRYVIIVTYACTTLVPTFAFYIAKAQWQALQDN